MAGPTAPVLAGHSYKGRTLATSLGTGVGACRPPPCGSTAAAPCPRT